MKAGQIGIQDTWALFIVYEPNTDACAQHDAANEERGREPVMILRIGSSGDVAEQP
jgi:hypothetical protein